MNTEKIGFIGLGLIGGSIAKAIKRIYPQTHIIATAGHLSTILEAHNAHTIDNPDLIKMEDFADCDCIFLCCPIKMNISYLKQLKSIVKQNCILTDVGSVKSEIHEEVIALNMENQFIGGHPMTGSEKTGFSSATPYLLENAYYILTPSAKIDTSIVADFRTFLSSLGALIIVMNYQEHDHVTASISHLPHVIAASLVHLISNIDDEDETMKTIAAGGFKDITRIASSSPIMWENICLSNQAQIISLIDQFTNTLQQTKVMIQCGNSESIYSFFESAKEYRDSINIVKSGPLKKVFEFYCDLIDETGGIATIATILASNNLSIKNIGIINNREFEEGVLRIEMQELDALNASIALLRKYHYTIYER